MSDGRKQPPGPAMTVANMRQNGVRSLAVSCNACHHEAVVNVDHVAEHIEIPSFAVHMVCRHCGAKGKADVRPNWPESTRGIGGKR